MGFMAGVLRQDAVWDKACCAPTQTGEATTCLRQSAMRWMCELESMVNTKAFAKSVRKVSPLAPGPCHTAAGLAAPEPHPKLLDICSMR